MRTTWPSYAKYMSIQMIQTTLTNDITLVNDYSHKMAIEIINLPDIDKFASSVSHFLNHFAHYEVPVSLSGNFLLSNLLRGASLIFRKHMSVSCCEKRRWCSMYSTTTLALVVTPLEYWIIWTKSDHAKRFYIPFLEAWVTLAYLVQILYMHSISRLRQDFYTLLYFVFRSIFRNF